MYVRGAGAGRPRPLGDGGREGTPGSRAGRHARLVGTWAGQGGGGVRNETRMDGAPQEQL